MVHETRKRLEITLLFILTFVIKFNIFFRKVSRGNSSQAKIEHKDSDGKKKRKHEFNVSIIFII